MLVNCIVILIILLIGLHYKNKYKNNFNSNFVKKRFIFSVSFILILQSGLRNVAVGTDTYTYFEYFQETSGMSWDQVFFRFIEVYKFGIGKDPGYTLFEKLVSLFSTNYQVFLFIIAILFFSALGNFLYNNSKTLSNLVLSYIIYSVLFYAFFSITGHRQTIATAFCLFSFEFLKKRKFFKFLILVLLGSIIHKSCLIFIPFYFLSYINNIKKTFWIIVLLFPFLTVVSSFVSKYIFSIINLYEEYGHNEDLKPTTFVFLILSIAILSLIKYDKIIKINPDSKYSYTGLMMGTVFLSLVFEIHGYMRIVQYFSLFILIIIPLLASAYKSYSKKIGKLAYDLIIVVLILLYVRSNWNTVPYGFFWQKMELSKD
ncbi:EpsG family protein [uncultured Chryseobacterium sp.]|uniref:EpsG family protein n=1 Tax=uncultured Chryseobacterium sp. TaxID=259322 RepID=UPI0025CDE049|nr:EpsG family protein [uncultured Chryseobacterium sp.]